jgi:hypothetical protein
MNKTLIFAVLAAIAGTGVAHGQTAMEQLQKCASGNCWQSSSQSMPADKTGTESADQVLSAYQKDNPSSGCPTGVPNLTVQPPPKHHGMSMKRAFAALVVAGAGAYAGFTYGKLAYLGFAGPWGAAAIGAFVAVAVICFLLPKIFKMFHHKKD